MSDVDISEVIDSTISVEDNFPTRAGFGTPMVVGYHHTTLDRVQSYATDSEVAEDYPTGHAIRLACQALFAQNPRPPIVKVGRRAGTPARSIRYTPINVVVGYVYSGTIGGVDWTYTVVTGDTVATIIDGIVAALAAALALAADDDAILTATATSASIQTLDTEFDGLVGGGTISPPKRVTCTRSAHADQDGVTAVLVGLDEYGAAQTENLTFANGGAEVVTSTKLWSKVTSLTIPAQSGTNGTTKIGTAAAIAVTDNTTSMDVACAVAGQWLRHTWDDVPSADMSVEDRTPSPGTTLSTDLTAILAADGDWYGLLVVDGTSSAQILDGAAWAETNKKLFIADTFDSAAASSSSTDVLSELEEAAYVQTAGFYHRDGDGYFPSARWAGRMLPTTPGTETWALKELAGLPADNLTSTERTQLKAKNANFYVEVAGLNMTFGAKNGGMAASGRFIDLVRYVQALNAQIQEAAIVPLANADKVPFDDFGISVIAAEIRAVLKAGEAQRSLRNIVLTIPSVDDVADADRADRILTGLAWDAIYTGAVHKARITGRLGV